MANFNGIAPRRLGSLAALRQSALVDIGLTKAGLHVACVARYPPALVQAPRQVVINGLSSMPKLTPFAGDVAAHNQSSRLQAIPGGAGRIGADLTRNLAPTEFAIPVWHVRSRSSQALLKVELDEHYRQLWKLVSIGLLVVDNTSSIVSSNAFARQLLKPSDTSAEAVVLSACVRREDAAKLHQFLIDIFEGQAPPAIDVQLAADDVNKHRHVRLEMVSVATLTAALTVVDISERKELEEGKLQAEVKLEQLQRLELVHTLSAGIAHDFKNIVQVIDSYATVLNAQTKLGEQANTIAQEIKAAAERGAVLANRWLAYGRHGELQRQMVDLGQFIGRSMETIGRDLPKSIRVETRCAVERLDCNLDPCLIEQVLFNLCFNARDAMPEGGTIEVSVERVSFDSQASSHDLLPAGDYAKISIADNGTGIPVEVLARIFEPFFTTKESCAGTGLGLALVKGIVSEHQGAIEVWSEVGLGSVFMVYLPLNPS